MSVENKYKKTHLFHYENINFTLNLSGFDFDLKVNKKQISQLKDNLEKIEKGEIMNKSENQAVDHYNLRMEEEKVKGKSLKNSLAQWKEVKEKVTKILDSGDFTDVIINGIGGSILGPVMMIIAIKGPEFYYNKDNKIKIHFLSNSDPDSFTDIIKNVNLEKTILVTMSKSGGTTESMTNQSCFIDILKEKGLPIPKHNIAITKKDSKMKVTDDKFQVGFFMNNETGGRTSIGCAIGMVASAFAGLNFEEFLKGESEMDKLTRQFGKIDDNPALLIALAVHKYVKKRGNKNMIVLGYSDYLREYSHYLQQLYMESLGKLDNLKGKKVSEGQTVFGGVGTSEQHAFMQQVQQGLQDCFVRFIYYLKRNSDYQNKDKSSSMGRNLLSFLKGTEHALVKNGKPFISSTFEKRDMFNLGLMIALEERIVTFLGFLKEINSYDQPGVELGKKSASEMNQVAGEIEKKVSELKGKWEGDAEKAKNEFKLDKFPIYYVDAVLSDIFANHEIKNSYPSIFGKYKVSRKFEKKKFMYTFELK